MLDNTKPHNENKINDLSDLDAFPIWAARGKEPGKLRRAPVNPRTNRLAKTNKSSTWGTRSEAVERASGYDEVNQPGVGIMLGDAALPGGLLLGGLDLDGCRNPESGDIEEWACQILWNLGTYAEASPSGGGLHLLFFAQKEDVASLRKEGLIAEFGRTHSKGSHVEIAAFFGNKFLTVTGDLHDDDLLGECSVLNHVGLDQLRWLLGEYAPTWAQNCNEKKLDRSGGNRDESGSGHGFRLACDLVREGFDDAEVIEAFEENFDEAGEWWGRATDREKERVIKNARRKIEADIAAIRAEFDDIDDADEETDDQAGETSIVEKMNARYALTKLGGAAVVADFADDAIEFVSVPAFKELNSNRKVGGRKLGSYWLEHPKRRTFDRGVVFDPSGRGAVGALNLWQGYAVDPDPNMACGLITEYIRDVVAGGDRDHADYIFSWMADMFQNPSRKPGVAMVLRGKKGVGKDTLAEILRRMIGKKHTAHVTEASRVTGRFNSQFATALLGHIEEASWGGDRSAKGVLQSLITAPTMALEKKGVDVVQVDSYLRLLFTANDEWVVPATADERRYAVFEVPPVRRNDLAYFGALYAQIDNGGLEGFLHFLLNWQVPEGVDVRVPPNTIGLTGQKLAGLKNIDAWWHAILAEGELPVATISNDNHFGDDDADWSEAGQTVQKSVLRDEYSEWMMRRRYDGETLDPARFGRELKRLCKAITETRPMIGDTRTKCYRLPPLDECRADFAQFVNVPSADIEWD